MEGTMISEAIRTRRTIKLFKPDAIEEAVLEELLTTASYAPNHRMTEPWEILVIGPSTRERLNHPKNFGGAPTVLAIVAKPADNAVNRNEYYAAVSCFIMNFQLAAWEKGIGTGWSSFGISPKAKETMHIQEGYEVVGLIPVGYPAEIPDVKPRTPIREKITHLP